jgi:hypothetical protein
VAGVPSGVGQLVQSIKQHKKFKQLASYSVQCLTKALLPPTVGWEANTKEAFQAGALEAITEVRPARCAAILSLFCRAERVHWAADACGAPRGCGRARGHTTACSVSCVPLRQPRACDRRRRRAACCRAQVLAIHSGVEEVLSSATKCLGSMVSNPEYAGALVRCGALRGMVDSVIKNPDAEQGVKETLHVLERVVARNAAAVLECDGAKMIAELLRCSNKPEIIAVCARTFEKLIRLPGGAEAFIAAGALEVRWLV